MRSASPHLRLFSVMAVVLISGIGDTRGTGVNGETREMRGFAGLRPTCSELRPPNIESRLSCTSCLARSHFTPPVLRFLLANIFHERGGQGEIDGNACDVIGRRHKGAGRNGRIYLHSLQQDGHERRHAG